MRARRPRPNVQPGGALVWGLLLVLAAVRPAAAQFFAPGMDTAVIAVTAMAEVPVAPDRIQLFVTFAGTAGDAEAALTAAMAEREGAIAALRELGVSAEQVALTGAGFGTAMEARRRPPAPGEGTSWEAMYGLRVTVRPVERLGAVLTALAGAGMDHVSYTVVQPGDDQAEALRRATRMAVEEGRVRAEAMAEAAGVRLGPLLAITTFPDYGAMNDNIRQFGGFPDRGARMIPMESLVRATVSMSWRIER